MTVPLGPLPPLTDAELDELSQITEEDIEEAKKLWKQNVPDDFVDLLDAQDVT